MKLGKQTGLMWDSKRRTCLHDLSWVYVSWYADRSDVRCPAAHLSVWIIRKQTVLVWDVQIQTCLIWKLRQVCLTHQYVSWKEDTSDIRCSEADLSVWLIMSICMLFDKQTGMMSDVQQKTCLFEFSVCRLRNRQVWGDMCRGIPVCLTYHECTVCMWGGK